MEWNVSIFRAGKWVGELGQGQEQAWGRSASQCLCGRWVILATSKYQGKDIGLFPQQLCPHPSPQAPDQSDSSQALPSMGHLIQVTPGTFPRPTQSPHPHGSYPHKLYTYP